MPVTVVFSCVDRVCNQSMFLDNVHVLLGDWEVVKLMVPQELTSGYTLHTTMHMWFVYKEFWLLIVYLQHFSLV